MRTPNHTQDGGVHFNMTPMIDVVFLLIIFFLVSSHLAKQEVHLELPLPAADSGEIPDADPAPRVTLNVLRSGTVLWGTREVPPQELSNRLTAHRAQTGDNLQVRIRCDRQVPYAQVSPILLACTRSGIWDVSFAVVQREGRR